MHNANLGEVALRRRRHGGCPMAQFDRLPLPLRRWMGQAALPWSPRSCLALWRKALAQGETEAQALARLSRAEARLLARRSRQVRHVCNITAP